MLKTPDLGEGGLNIFSEAAVDKGGERGLKEVNFKLRLVYRVTGYVATGRQIYSTCTLQRD